MYCLLDHRKKKASCKKEAFLILLFFLYFFVYNSVLKESKTMTKNFSNSLINELAQYIDPVLCEFLKTCKGRYEFAELSMVEHLEVIFSTTLKDFTGMDQFSKIVRNEKTKRQRNKERWFEKTTEAYLNGNTEDENFPFAAIVSVYKNSSIIGKQKDFFGNDSLEDVIKKEYEKTKKWLNDPFIPLISYPAIFSITEKRIQNAFYSDILINLKDIIKEHFDGNINDYYKIMPEMLIDKPIFSSKKMNLDLVPNPANTKEFVEKLLFEDGTEFITEYTLTAEGTQPISPVTAFDKYDLDIISGIVANAYMQPEFYQSGIIRGNVRTAAKSFNPRPGKNDYDKAKERLEKYQQFSYKRTFANQDFESYSLFSDIKVVDGMYEAVCSRRLKDSIIKQQTVRITQKKYNSLDNPMAKTLCYTLQNQRIAICSKKNAEVGERTKSYDYLFFAMATRMPNKQKTRNIKLIIEALDEMKSQSLIIEDFKFKGNSFTITFYPLTEAEREDIHMASAGEDIIEMESKDFPSDL